MTKLSAKVSDISQISSEPSQPDQPQLPFFEESVLNAYKSRQYGKCIKTIERILKVTPEAQSSHYKILLAAANTMIGRNFKRSHNLLNEVLKVNPFDAYALYGKGVAFYFENKFEESLQYFDRAIAVDENGMEMAKEMKVKAQVANKEVRVVLKKLKMDFDAEDAESAADPAEQIVKEELKEPKQDSKIQKASPLPAATSEPSRILRNRNKNDTKSLSVPIQTENSTKSAQQSPKTENHPPAVNKFLTEEFKEYKPPNLDTSMEDDSNLSMTTSANSFAQQNFNKGLDLYMVGEFERSLKYFQESLSLEPDLEEADELATKAQEYIDLLEVVAINMTEKNYGAVVVICNEGLDVDEDNDVVNRKFIFQRGLAYCHLGEDEKSMRDYEEYERLGRKLEKK